MHQNGGGGMAQFGQMGLNQFSQMQTPQNGMMMPMMMMPQMYGQPMYPQQMMAPMMGNQSMVQNNNQIQQDQMQQQRQFDQDQGMDNNDEGMGRRNISQSQMMIDQPISKPSAGFQAQDRYGKVNKQKEYAQMLDFQLDLKKQKKTELKNLDQMQVENLKNERIKSQIFAGQGQLQRDEFGNIMNTKLNPANPNYQPLDWFSHMAHKDEYQNNARLAQSMSVQSLGNVPDLAIYDPDLKRQRELGQRLQTAKSQAMNMNQEKVMRAQEAFENAIPQQNFSRPAPINQGVDILKMRKRQQAQELLREQMEQIEEKKRQKQLRSIQEQRERDLEDLKIQREVDEINKRMQQELSDSKLGNKNLYQSSIEQGKSMIKRSLQDLEINGGNSSIKFTEAQPQIKTSIKKSVVIEEPQQYNEDYSNNVRIEQRYVKELPIEITATVKETVNNELLRLRNEMNMQSNSLGEQILGMKSQLMKANERRFQAEEDVKKLRDELKKTQVIDEIRQRELYNAFVLTDKPNIHSNLNTNKIYDTEFKFELPSRPKPYYNMQDPYLDNYNKEFDKDNHGVLEDVTKHIPVGEYDYTQDAVSNKRKLDEQFFFDKQEFNDLEKGALDVHTDNLFNLPDDYLNRQNLYYGKNSVKGGSDDFDYQGYMIQNQNRLDKLQEIDTFERKGELDKLDEALFDLASHSNQENRFKKRYEQEENLKDIEDFVSFQTKLNRYS